MTIAVNKQLTGKITNCLVSTNGIASILGQLSCRNEGTNERKFSFSRKKEEVCTATTSSPYVSDSRYFFLSFLNWFIFSASEYQENFSKIQWFSTTPSEMEVQY